MAAWGTSSGAACSRDSRRERQQRRRRRGTCMWQATAAQGMRVGRISTIQQLQLPASAGSLPRLAALLSRSQAAGSSAAGASACGIAWPAAAVSAPAAHSAASSSTGAACGHRSPHREHYLCCSGWPQRSAGSPLPLVAGPTCGKGCHVCLLAWPLPTAESLPPPRSVPQLYRFLVRRTESDFNKVRPRGG